MDEDLKELCSYIFETEREDVIYILTNEGYVIEEEIISVKDAESLSEMSEEEQDEVLEKCCMNPKFNHVYARALRVFNQHQE
jgi:hypothetical protein